MSAKNEEVADGGLEGPSGGVEESGEAISQIAQHIAAVALGSDGELSENAKFQISLRRSEERPLLLEYLVDAVCPSGVNSAPWIDWIGGGQSPFGDGKLQKTGVGKERPSQTLFRASERVSSLRDKIRQREEANEADRVKLAKVEAMEKAALHWHVTDQLLSLVGPVFAMGPAWTILRSITGTAPESHVEELTAFFDGKEKVKEAGKVRQEYADEAAQIQVALDLFSGHEEFEKRLRGAIKSVVDEFSDRHDEVINSGGRRRSVQRMMSSINPEGAKGFKEVLEGFETKD